MLGICLSHSDTLFYPILPTLYASVLRIACQAVKGKHGEPAVEALPQPLPSRSPLSGSDVVGAVLLAEATAAALASPREPTEDDREVSHYVMGVVRPELRASIRRLIHCRLVGMRISSVIALRCALSTSDYKSTKSSESSCILNHRDASNSAS